MNQIKLTIVIVLMFGVIKQWNVAIPARLKTHFFRKYSASKFVFFWKVHKTDASYKWKINKQLTIKYAHKYLLQAIQWVEQNRSRLDTAR